MSDSLFDEGELERLIKLGQQKVSAEDMMAQGARLAELELAVQRITGDHKTHDMLFQKFGELEGCVIQFGSFYLDQLDGQKTPLRVYLSLPRVSPTRQQTSRGYSPCLIIQPSRKNLFVLGQIDKYLLPNLQFTLLASHPYTQRQLQGNKEAVESLKPQQLAIQLLSTLEMTRNNVGIEDAEQKLGTEEYRSTAQLIRNSYPFDDARDGRFVSGEDLIRFYKASVKGLLAFHGDSLLRDSGFFNLPSVGLKIALFSKPCDATLHAFNIETLRA